MTSRNFVFTINNPTEEKYELLRTIGCRFIAYADETAPTTGTHHIQGYICFTVPTRVTAVRKLLPGAFVDIMKGRIDQNDLYINKEGVATERGDKPKTQKEKGELEKARWTECREEMRQGLPLTDPQLDIMFGHHKKRIRREYLLSQPLQDTEEENVWIYGPPRTGKSRAARDAYPNAYHKDLTKWWDGYTDQDTVIIDDYGKYDVALTTLVKRWADRYPFPAEDKGGYMQIRPRRVIVTSNFHPNEIWTGVDLEAILARFTLVNKL